MLMKYFFSIRRCTAAVVCLLASWAAQACVAAEVADPTQLLKDVAGTDRDARYKAIDLLGGSHEHAAAIVPELAKLLGDSDPQTRWRAVRALGDYGSQAASEVANVRKLLADADPIVQYHAVVALGKLEDRSDETVDALVNAATNKDARVARAAIASIRSLRPGPKRVVDALLKALQSNDQAVTLHALETLSENGPAAVPFLKVALGHTETAYLACAAIERIGPPAAPTVPELTEILGKTKHSKMLIQTLLALASIGPAASPATPKIVPLLSHETDDTVPVAAAFALGSIGATGVDAELRRAAADSDPFLQMMATWAIAKTHPGDPIALKSAIEQLTQALKSDNIKIRTAAARCLQSLNAPPELIAPGLVALTADPNPEVRENVIEAIASLGESIVPRLNNALKRPLTRKPAVQVAAKLGPKAAGAVTSLIEAATADPALRTDVQLALGAIGPKAAPATEMLAKSLSSQQAGERESALYALRKIGPGAKAAASPLAEKMQADGSFDSYAAAWALARIAPGDEKIGAAIVAKLEQGLKHADEQTRMECVTALGELGAAAESAKAALEHAAKEDSSPVVRAAAAAALKP